MHMCVLLLHSHSKEWPKNLEPSRANLASRPPILPTTQYQGISRANSSWKLDSPFNLTCSIPRYPYYRPNCTLSWSSRFAHTFLSAQTFQFTFWNSNQSRKGEPDHYSSILLKNFCSLRPKRNYTPLSLSCCWANFQSTPLPHPLTRGLFTVRLSTPRSQWSSMMSVSTWILFSTS